MKGTRVYHFLFKEGVVLDERWSGMELLVQFDHLGKLWMKRNALKLLGPPPKPKPVFTPIEIRPWKKGDFKARRMIEAFRMGIVPSFAVEDFTFGREKELEAFQGVLQGKKRVLLLEGEYGSGKTHLLDYVYFWALKKGFAVAKTELDPWDVAPHRPKHIYRELMQSLRLLEDGKKESYFQDILRKAKDLELPQPHLFFSKALELLKKGKESEAFWNWIEGEPLKREYLNYLNYWKLPVLLDHAPATDMYCYLLSGLGYILKALGAKGILILLDEAETLFRLWYRRESEMGFYFYKGLIQTALDHPKLRKLELKGATSTPFSIGLLDRHGFIHSGVRPLPYLYQSSSGLFLIIALTPSASVYLEEVKTLAPTITLSKLVKKDYQEMWERLKDLYEEAYPPLKLEPSLSTKLKAMDEAPERGEGIRYFLRTVVEHMDLYRHYGSYDKSLIQQ